MPHMPPPSTYRHAPQTFSTNSTLPQSLKRYTQATQVPRRPHKLHRVKRPRATLNCTQLPTRQIGAPLQGGRQTRTCKAGWLSRPAHLQHAKEACPASIAIPPCSHPPSIEARTWACVRVAMRYHPSRGWPLTSSEGVGCSCGAGRWAACVGWAAWAWRRVASWRRPRGPAQARPHRRRRP